MPTAPRILILDDDHYMAECIARAIRPCESTICTNAIDALSYLDSPPDLIFLDLLLDGPDGFAFLNELASYTETAKIPVIIVTSLNLTQDLSAYGVKKVLSKDTLTPRDLQQCVKKCLKFDFFTQKPPSLPLKTEKCDV